MNAKLLIIGPSHYCEKSRWSLEKAGIAFEEEGRAPFFHIPVVRSAGGNRTTPVLLTSDSIQKDSVDISHWIQQNHLSKWKPYGDNPEEQTQIRELEKEFGRKLGVLTRLLTYHFLLPHKKLVLDVMSYNTPSHEINWISRLYPAFSFMMRRAMNVNAQNAKRAHSAILQIFEDIEERAKGEFLVGHTLSIADISFASLSAPILSPAKYGVTTVPKFSKLPSDLQNIIHGFRQTTGGKRVLRLYETYR